MTGEVVVEEGGRGAMELELELAGGDAGKF